MSCRIQCISLPWTVQFDSVFFYLQCCTFLQDLSNYAEGEQNSLHLLALHTSSLTHKSGSDFTLQATYMQRTHHKQKVYIRTVQ